jgi:hypothetical protein
MSRVRAKRLGWNETTNVVALDILDPYEAPSDDLEGELVVVRATGPLTKRHTVYLVDGQPADPNTVEEIK